MSLHRLQSVRIGVPDPEPVAEYYAEFGLTPEEDLSLSTTDGGRQLFLEHATTRRLNEVVIGVDDVEDLNRVATALTAAGREITRDDTAVRVIERETDLAVVLRVIPRLEPGSGAPAEAESYNGPGRTSRSSERAPAILRQSPVRPRRLGHAVVTTPNLRKTRDFFTDLIGFKVSDYIDDIGVFLRCSTDHHNLLVLAAPVVFLHHTAWEVDDIDDVGRGAAAMLDGHLDRHVWGLGRHYGGSNFFWYLKDPAGNFSEYYADLDHIPEGAPWEPQVLSGPLGLYRWGPPPPAAFLAPDDLEQIMADRS